MGRVWDGEQSLLVLLPHDEHLQQAAAGEVGGAGEEGEEEGGRGQTKAVHQKRERETERGGVSGYILTDRRPNENVGVVPLTCKATPQNAHARTRLQRERRKSWVRWPKTFGV